MIKQTSIVLSLVVLGFGRSLATQYVSLNNKSCMVRPTLIDLNPDELHYYLFVIILGRCDGSCNTVEDPFGILPNKKKDVNLKVFNKIKGINDSKTLANYISCEYTHEFDDRKYNSRPK